jgi:hypothetical protein
MSNQRNTASVERLVTNLRDDVPSRALMAGAETWWSTMAESQREFGRFISDRLAKDGEAIREILTCRNLTDALDIQARWMDETLRDYNAELSRLTGLYSKIAVAGVHDERRRS